MSAADEAWQEWFSAEWDDCNVDDDAHQEMKRTTREAFVAGYVRALEDAADAVAEATFNLTADQARTADRVMTAIAIKTQTTDLLRAQAAAVAPRETKD